jgi:hypothetical protein
MSVFTALRAFAHPTLTGDIKTKTKKPRENRGALFEVREEDFLCA